MMYVSENWVWSPGHRFWARVPSHLSVEEHARNMLRDTGDPEWGWCDPEWGWLLATAQVTSEEDVRYVDGVADAFCAPKPGRGWTIDELEAAGRTYEAAVCRRMLGIDAMSRIKRLRDEAVAYGLGSVASLCDRALDGDTDAMVGALAMLQFDSLDADTVEDDA